MIENRELTMDDYFAMLRRRVRVILIPTLLAPLAGFALSYAFSPKYTSESLVLVEEPKVSENYVKPVASQDLSQRVATLQQRALSAENLRPLIETLGIAHGANIDGAIDGIRANVGITPVITTAVGPAAVTVRGKSALPGFNVSFTASNPHRAQEICAGVTNIMIRENLNDNTSNAQNTRDFLGRQVEDAKHNLDQMDAKLADFKRRYEGQLPGTEDKNLQILMGMNSQLDANTQTLNRAQQDKAYTESMLAQQLAAWKSSQTSTNPQSLQQQLATLQAQLISLQAHYTDDYPDVVKTKRDIAEVQKKLDEINTAAANPTDVASQKENLSEPPEIRQLRMQIHQYEQLITQGTREQQRLQEQIKVLQGRMALSPAIEEEYKELTRDYDTAQKFYDDRLANKKQAEMQVAAVQEQQGETMSVLNPADLPDSPSFPNRVMFAGGGFAGGLVLGLGLAIWLEMRDTSLRTEKDVVAVLDLPVLSQVPWVGVAEDEKSKKNGNRKWKIGAKEKEKAGKETVEV
jgi:polysaccharide chain length determinant protein (PEP-CTERM system associated)